ncbi:hypothetical protein V6N11_072326 [Hibiscus sabdariffa]|uniref:Uncharacterized protein n=1 Tax=Hibiscus sabdariffa TaxID=183260 RepID=A0ABR2U3J1_9ROSI
MADRFFPNVLPDFVAETSQHEEEMGNALIKLLSMPYSSLSQQFKRTALDLKETITLETWGVTAQNVSDFTLYCGTLGSAFLLFKSYRLTDNANDLSLCLAMVDACNSASLSSRDVTFLCGRAGVCALGAVAARYAGNQELLNHYLTQFREIKLSRNLPDELLYGRAGAAEVFGDDEFLEAAMDAAEVVWNRGLLKRVGICHGVSGNAYVFLSLYRKTGNVEFLYRAKAFACFLLDQAHKLIPKGEMHGGDSPYSLFEGIGGMAYLFLDMIEPLSSRFPAYEL